MGTLATKVTSTATGLVTTANGKCSFSGGDGDGLLNVERLGEKEYYSEDILASDLDHYIIRDSNRNEIAKVTSVDYHIFTTDVELSEKDKFTAHICRTVADGESSFAFGKNAVTIGDYSCAKGSYTTAKGSGSSAKGSYSVATGDNAEASGLSTTAIGNNSHAEGSCNESHGSASHAEGFGNTAWGSCSHAGGDGSLNVVLTGSANATTYATNIQPNDSWVGRLIKPSNLHSNAVIYISAIDAVNKTITVTETLDAENPITAALYYIALGGTYHANSFAHGKGVVTGETEQAVFGRYNLPTSGALFVVGNGLSYANPSNAFYIDARGNANVAGNLKDSQGNIIDITKFVTVGDHSGAGEDHDKIYIPSAEAEKETYDNIMVTPADNNKSAVLKNSHNVVTGNNSVAFGTWNKVSNTESFCSGKMNVIGAPKCYAEGNGNIVNANLSHAEGSCNRITRATSHAEGSGNYINSKNSHGEGNSIFVITITGEANSKTYTVNKNLPPFCIGLAAIYVISPTDETPAVIKYTTITALDTENNTITFDTTFDSQNAITDAEVRILAQTTQLHKSHVEGCYNFNILNDSITENPLIGTVFEDEYIAEREDRLQGGHIEGYGNVVAGKYAHAEGAFNLITNNLGHAEGFKNRALYYNAHVEGYNNEASRNSAHAEGSHSIAAGNQSHAEGYCTKANGKYSHTEGYNTLAGNSPNTNDGYNHSEGFGTITINQAAHSEGFNTFGYGLASHAEGYGKIPIHLTGNEGDTTYTTNIAPADDWLNSYLSFNFVTTDSPHKIIAIDKINNTITLDSTLSSVPNPNKQYNVILSKALGAGSHVEGIINIAEANSSHAEGAYNRATKLSSHVEGWGNVSAGEASHAEGKNGRAYGDYSHTEGYANTAFGKASHAGGDGSLIVNLTGAAKATVYTTDITPHQTWVGRLIKKVAEENYIQYILITDVDINKNTITVSETLNGTTALSATPYSIALGGASADYSFAHGKGVQAGTEAGAVFGKFNVPRNNALFAIGNGTSYTDQKDAFYVDVDGNVYIAGNIVSTQITQLTNKITELENRIAALEGKS